MSTLLMPILGFSSFGISKGASDFAKRAERQTNDVVKSIKWGIAGGVSPVANELLGLAEADEVSMRALAKAILFALLLPPDVQPPEISVDPDGEIAFDWDGNDGMVSVSVGPQGRIVYAAEIGFKPTSGTVQLSAELPEGIRASLDSFRSIHAV
ncbi:hypothetical protein ACNI65_24785 [Roseateles sp. So40a]|uniref:hypothetical protein n=1 Tax=Roseateles sp. So40a TaxID=3400226 RepID=UPI003A89606E